MMIYGELNSIICSRSLSCCKRRSIIADCTCGRSRFCTVCRIWQDFIVVRFIWDVSSLYMPMCTLVHPSISNPMLIGPLYVRNVMYLGTGPYTDFYFICRIDYVTEHQRQHQQPMVDDGARFEVTLTFDSQLSSTVTKTTTSSALEVRFTSRDVHDGFGTKVSPALLIRFMPLMCKISTAINRYCKIITFAKNLEHTTTDYSERRVHTCGRAYQVSAANSYCLRFVWIFDTCGWALGQVSGL